MYGIGRSYTVLQKRTIIDIWGLIFMEQPSSKISNNKHCYNLHVPPEPLLGTNIPSNRLLFTVDAYFEHSNVDCFRQVPLRIIALIVVIIEAQACSVTDAFGYINRLDLHVVADTL